MKEYIVLDQCVIVSFHLFQLSASLEKINKITNKHNTMIKHNIFFHPFDFLIFQSSSRKLAAVPTPSQLAASQLPATSWLASQLGSQLAVCTAIISRKAQTKFK